MRLFIAIDLSASIRKSLSEQIRDLEKILDTSAIRWVKPSAIHITLKFLGETPEHKVERIQSTLTEIAPRFSPFTVQIGTFGCFPNLRKPRVLWVGIQDQTGSLKKIYHELEMEFRKLGFKAENRPFRAHLTLGRVKKNLNSAALDTLRSQLGDVRIEELGKETVEAICLIRSILRPTGAEYTRLGLYELTERGK
jgi:2'-5' RNA ligase